jgi:CheY-like chemotaxis protein
MTRILVIEDSVDLRVLMQKELEHAGYTVQVAEGGHAALKMHHLFRPDIVVTDLFMPGGDGFEAITELRKKFPTPKIIAISAGAGPIKTEYLDNAKKAGADAALLKPFKMRALLELIGSMAR